jgi:hypothetical protein
MEKRLETDFLQAIPLRWESQEVCRCTSSDSPRWCRGTRGAGDTTRALVYSDGIELPEPVRLRTHHFCHDRADGLQGAC